MDQAISFFLSEDFLSIANPYLLQAEIAAAALLGIGIVYESDKYSKAVHASAFWFVVIGVVLETVFSILLFGSEERIASLQRGTIEAQQTKIIALREITSQRSWTKYQFDAIQEIGGKIDSRP